MGQYDTYIFNLDTRRASHYANKRYHIHLTKNGLINVFFLYIYFFFILYIFFFILYILFYFFLLKKKNT